MLQHPHTARAAQVQFVRMALDAAGGSLDVFLSKFDKADVDYAKELYVA